MIPPLARPRTAPSKLHDRNFFAYSRKSFEELVEKFSAKIEKKRGALSKLAIVVCGSKSDLEDQREIPMQEAGIDRRFCFAFNVLL